MDFIVACPLCRTDHVLVLTGDPSSPWGDVHPRYKQQVAERLALSGLSIAYGVPGLYFSGPIPSKVAPRVSLILSLP
jgi:hypothetical protein